MAFEIDLDCRLSSPDPELFRAACDAIDYALWCVGNEAGREVRMRSLPEPHRVILHLARFRIVASDGLGGWFEQDGDHHGPSMVAALQAVGLGRSARALAAAYAVFERHDAWDVMEERMDLLAARRDVFEPLEHEVFQESCAIEAAGGRFVREHCERLRRGR